MRALICVLALAATADSGTWGVGAAHRLRVAGNVGTLVWTVLRFGPGASRICVLEADRNVLDAVNHSDRGTAPRLGLSSQSHIWYLLCVFQNAMAMDESGSCRVMRFAGRREFASCFQHCGGKLGRTQVQHHDHLALPYAVPDDFYMVPHPDNRGHQALPPRNSSPPVKFDLVAIWLVRIGASVLACALVLSSH